MPDQNTLPTGFTYTVGVQYTFSASPNDTPPTVSDKDSDLCIIVSSLFLIIWISGLVGNGTVIFFLSFVIQRNPIATYVLNLAAADSGVLICFGLSILFGILQKGNTDKISLLFFLLFYFLHSINLHLLTAISVERCASILFPIWYRCHRPKHQSAIVCTLIWAISFLLIIIMILIKKGIYFHGKEYILLMIVCAINLLLCTPLMVICTLTLFIRVCCGLHRWQNRRLSIVLLFALFFFIILGIPLNVVTATFIFDSNIPSTLVVLGPAFATINSSVNPLVYYVIGRRKTRQSREILKMVLQTVFSEQDLCEEAQNPVEFQMQ